MSFLCMRRCYRGGPSAVVIRIAPLARYDPRRMVTLICTVRDCRAPLAADGRRYVCAHRHSFDLARSGYLNLLQPQDRRSKNPGDSAEAVAARRRFLDRGHAAPLREAFLGLVAPYAAGTVLDAGCGEGHYLGAMATRFPIEAEGLDLSVPALELAARRYPSCRFVVANADRLLPYADESFALITSITARMNAPEFRRILAPAGWLVVAIPAPDDLLELRAALLGQGLERDRVQRTVETFRPGFTLQRQERLHHLARLDPVSIADLLASTYRGLRAREREKVAALGAMEVTLALDVLVFA
jgi:23S rRNA (guanine745-N1)-methyltransferase